MTDGLSEKNLQNLLKTIESTIKVNTQEIERGIEKPACF